MPLLRLRGLPSLPVIEGDGLVLRAPKLADYAAWSRLRAESRDFLAPWEPVWPQNDLSKTAFRMRVRRVTDDMRADIAYAFLVTRAETGEILGGLTLSQVRRRVAMTGTLGYWIGRPHARQGHMSRAVRLTLAFSFNTLGLRRIEAACLPHNAASIALLEKVGFQREGYAREYLQIAGRWQDHLLYAMLARDFASAQGQTVGLPA
ncbi:MAG: GNAT family N-acetyltransferase [Rhizobiales bacterium 65-9]|nr:GNAT family N-acetyltransferase [Hyphomicrobiales bacterium]OJY38217.1 MAG: GNAT family N-acetyltransferase [Rhizobiales bacterium 65-9]